MNPAGNHQSDQRGKLCLATVSSDSFISGTVTMLHTFLLVHPGFNGDICIIHRGLAAAYQEMLASEFPRLSFKSVSRDLDSKIGQLVSADPALMGRRDRFLSLEVLTLSGYDRVLFCDSDILFKGAISDAFEVEADLLCCGDIAYYQGRGRDCETFEACDRQSTTSVFHAPFNSGLMIFDGRVCNENEHASMLESITPGRFGKTRTGHTDQFFFNLHFAGRQQMLHARYNFLLPRADMLTASTGEMAEKALVWHFNGPAKPWLPDQLLLTAKDNPIMVSAAKVWQEAFNEFLAQSLLKKRRGTE